MRHCYYSQCHCCCHCRNKNANKFSSLRIWIICRATATFIKIKVHSIFSVAGERKPVLYCTRCRGRPIIDQIVVHVFSLFMLHFTFKFDSESNTQRNRDILFFWRIPNMNETCDTKIIWLLVSPSQHTITMTTKKAKERESEREEEEERMRTEAQTWQRRQTEVNSWKIQQSTSSSLWFTSFVWLNEWNMNKERLRQTASGTIIKAWMPLAVHKTLTIFDYFVRVRQTVFVCGRRDCDRSTLEIKSSPLMSMNEVLWNRRVNSKCKVHIDEVFYEPFAIVSFGSIQWKFPRICRWLHGQKSRPRCNANTI